jgi:hypothetical protein
MRNEQEIIRDLQNVEAALSPENLHWDGERDPKEAKAAEKRLLKERAALVKELGREPTGKELFG